MADVTRSDADLTYRYVRILFAVQPTVSPPAVLFESQNRRVMTYHKHYTWQHLRFFTDPQEMIADFRNKKNRYWKKHRLDIIQKRTISQFVIIGLSYLKRNIFGINVTLIM
jgi:hypothetical protein